MMTYGIDAYRSYGEAVAHACEAVGHAPNEWWVEGEGLQLYWSEQEPGMDTGAWPHGLALLWQADKGWSYAPLGEDRVPNEDWTEQLPVHGIAAPEVLADLLPYLLNDSGDALVANRTRWPGFDQPQTAQSRQSQMSDTAMAAFFGPAARNWTASGLVVLQSEGVITVEFFGKAIAVVRPVARFQDACRWSIPIGIAADTGATGYLTLSPGVVPPDPLAAFRKAQGPQEPVELSADQQIHQVRAAIAAHPVLDSTGALRQLLALLPEDTPLWLDEHTRVATEHAELPVVHTITPRIVATGELASTGPLLLRPGLELGVVLVPESVDTKTQQEQAAAGRSLPPDDAGARAAWALQGSNATIGNGLTAAADALHALAELIGKDAAEYTGVNSDARSNLRIESARIDSCAARVRALAEPTQRALDDPR